MPWNPTYRAAFRARDDDGAISTGRLSYRADNVEGARAHLAALTSGIGGIAPVSPTGQSIEEALGGYVGYDEGRW